MKTVPTPGVHPRCSQKRHCNGPKSEINCMFFTGGMTEQSDAPNHRFHSGCEGVNHRQGSRVDVISRGLSRMEKKPISEGLSLYDSVYIMLLKWQNSVLGCEVRVGEGGPRVVKEMFMVTKCSASWLWWCEASYTCGKGAPTVPVSVPWVSVALYVFTSTNPLGESAWGVHGFSLYCLSNFPWTCSHFKIKCFYFFKGTLPFGKNYLI